MSSSSTSNEIDVAPAAGQGVPAPDSRPLRENAGEDGHRSWETLDANEAVLGADLHLVHVFEPDYRASSMVAIPMVVPELEVGNGCDGNSGMWRKTIQCRCAAKIFTQ